VAKYGFTLYGLKKYGQLDGSQLYYNAALVAAALDYNTILVSWDTIAIDPADPSPTHWKLVRTLFGAPQDPQSGTTVASGVIAVLPTQYTDTVPEAQTGQEIYYSIWLFNGIDWVFCGEASAMAVPDTGSLLNITRRLPAAWLNSSQGIGDATGGYESNNQLVTFLSGLIFAYDYQRSQAALLEKVADYRRVPTKLLQSAVANVSMPYEPALGSGVSRTLYRVGHIVNAEKGSGSGVRNFVSALTHWGSSVSLGRNLMLDYNDSSFEESVGAWTIDNGTLTRVTYAGSLAAVGSAITPPVTTNVYSLFPTRQVAFAVVNSTGTANLKLGHANMPYSGIPVKAGNSYTFSAYVMPLQASLAMTWTITWWGRSSLLSSVTNSFATGTQNTWSQYRFDAQAPDGALYAEVGISFTGATNHHLIDMLQFEVTPKAIRYQDARTVEIKVDSDRTNFLYNPAFDNGTGGWYGKNATIIQDSNPTVTPIFGSSVARVAATGSIPAIISEWTPVTPGAPLTFSAYVAGSGTAVARVEFSTPQSSADQISILSDSNGSYFPVELEKVDGSSVTLSSSSFQQVTVSAQAPTLVSDNGAALAKVSIYFPSGTSGSAYYVDACLLEQTTQNLSYFQGNGGPAPVNPLTDQFINLNYCRWEWREQTNLVSNSIFNTTTGWSGSSGTTLSSVSTGAAPFAGNKMLKVVRQAAGTATITSTVYLEQPVAAGGEDLVLSIRITGFTGQVSIGDGTTSQSFTIPSEAATGWSELWCSLVTSAGQTSLTFTVSATMTGAGTFYLDAAQAEAGRIPGKFVDPSDIHVTSRPNLSRSSSVVWDVFQPQYGAGRSYYWSQYYTKYNRLAKSLEQVMPMGSSWEVISGRSGSYATDPSSSILGSPSFETSLDSWNPDSSSLKRVVSRGSHFSEFGANGASWCQVTSTAAGAFGLHADSVEVTSLAGYYLSAAVRPVSGAGTFTLKVDWLDINSGYLWSTIVSSRVTNTDRWSYIALTDKNVHNLGSAGTPNYVFGSYAKVSVSFTSDSPAVGNTFLVDRVIFRE
jgi:hypothetical protein